MNKRLLSSVLAVALGLGGAFLTANTYAQDVSPNTAPSAPPTSSLTKQVKAALADPALGAKKVKVSNKKGVITLSGSAPSQAQAAQIADAVSKVDGVKSVVNHIDTPDSIAGQVKAALRKEPSLHGFNIKTREKDGVVTIAGSVENQDQAAKAEDVAKGVTGVTSVVNHVTVMMGHN